MKLSSAQKHAQKLATPGNATNLKDASSSYVGLATTVQHSATTKSLYLAPSMKVVDLNIKKLSKSKIIITPHFFILFKRRPMARPRPTPTAIDFTSNDDPALVDLAGMRV